MARLCLVIRTLVGLTVSVFVRLMERGVFHVSVQFVEEVLRHLDNTPEDIKLQHILLHRLPQADAIMFLRKATSTIDEHERNRFLLEYHTRKLCDGAHFLVTSLPLSLLLINKSKWLIWTI